LNGYRSTTTASLLLIVAAFLYFIYYELLGDERTIFSYFMSNLAFVPVEVAIVTIIVQRWLAEREKRALYRKLNMVIGAFFSEVGTVLLRQFFEFDVNSGKFLQDSRFSQLESRADLEAIRRGVGTRSFDVDSRQGDLQILKATLLSRRDFLLRLLENPILMEHETFTDLLWAVFHLSDELSWRENLKSLSVADYEHLSGDIRRAYGALVSEWLSYLIHLNINYPFLFSLAIRTNPFNPNASVVFEDKLNPSALVPGDSMAY
jgi:hypothetical protein